MFFYGGFLFELILIMIVRVGFVCLLIWGMMKLFAFMTGSGFVSSGDRELRALQQKGEGILSQCFLLSLRIRTVVDKIQSVINAKHAGGTGYSQEELKDLGTLADFIEDEKILEKRKVKLHNQFNVYIRARNKEKTEECLVAIESLLNDIQMLYMSVQFFERKYLGRGSNADYAYQTSDIGQDSYFKGCKTEAERKKRYRELSKKLHPDNGGDEEEYLKMKAEYDMYM